MSADDTAPSGEGERCPDRDPFGAGRCALADGHKGPHTAHPLTTATATRPMTAAVPDLREQLARALWADLMDPPGRDWLDDEEKAHALAIGDRLLPVVTAHVAAERERAVAKVVEPIRALREDWATRLPGSKYHAVYGQQMLSVEYAVQGLDAALPAQPADQAQETDR